MNSFVPESPTSIQTSAVHLLAFFAHCHQSMHEAPRASFVQPYRWIVIAYALHCIEPAEEVWRPRFTGKWPCLQDFLRQCFQKDPEKRPGAEALLKHPWLLINRQTLRASWSRTKDRKSRGGRTQAHASVASVVERMLEVLSLSHN